MSTSNPPLAKRLKTGGENVSQSSQSNNHHNSPRSIVTWNCNGFVTRCKYSVPELKRLVETTNSPDMICLQEARLKAHSSQCRGQPMDSEYNGAVEQALNSVFQEYLPFWSLADNRYAGTLTLLHHRFGSQVQVAYSFDSAIDLLLKQFGLTRDQVGGLKAIESEKSGENINNNNNKPKQQKSISSFFKVAKPAASSKKRPRSSNQQQRHHEEGRFQFFLFRDMDIVQTYAPNNGFKMEKFEKRKGWDSQVLEFVRQRQAIVTVANNTNHRSLLWCGDLNVAHQYMDGTNWEPKADGSFYEWWTDESKCIIDKKNRGVQKPPEYVGMPSFTPAERSRFATLLEQGNLVDVWRHLHPKPSQCWNAPEWTWRGKGNVYGNKGQRLDYFLLSCHEPIEKRVESCRILGTGNFKGLFCGSDHCASILVLKNETEDGSATE